MIYIPYAWAAKCCSILMEENFEDTKGVIRSRKSKDSQYNGQKKEKTEGQTIIFKKYTEN